MVFINEWLPNPVGADEQGEFIELWNSDAVVADLRGWALGTGGKRRHSLDFVIPPDGYLSLPRSMTKLALKNTDGMLALYDAAGVVRDRSSFFGAAPEGKSFNRVFYGAATAGDATSGVQQFAWGRPTPGGKNEASMDVGISQHRYPEGVPLARDHLSPWSAAALAFAAGVIFAAALWYAMKKDEAFAQLFFGGNEKNRH